jgi:hypothetical protein
MAGMRAPGASFVSATCFTISCSLSSLQVILTRWGFFGSLVTDRHRHVGLSSSERISFSIVVRIVPAESLASSSSGLETSIVQ